MYISVPRAHQRTVFCRRLGLRLRDVDAEELMALLAEVARAGTWLMNVATEEGHGFGTLGRHQCDVKWFWFSRRLTFQQQSRVHYRTFAGPHKVGSRSCTARGFAVEFEVQLMVLRMRSIEMWM